MSDSSEGSQESTGKAAYQKHRSQRFTDMLNAPVNRKTPLGTDTAWALKLKDAVYAAVRELHVEVLSAKPVQSYEAGDKNDMLFELDTNEGHLQAIRTRAGTHVFHWM